jgi:ssDNA-binding Zn-finger/Zn-ribbon topoisomerase 1
MQCPNCGKATCIGTAEGCLRFVIPLLYPIRSTPRGAVYDALESSEKPLSVRLPAFFCLSCRCLTIPPATQSAPQNCPDCGLVLTAKNVAGILHFVAEGESQRPFLRWWRNFLRDTQVRGEAAYCSRCSYALIQQDTLIEVQRGHAIGRLE